MLELEHYGTVKRLRNWEGRAGSNVAKFGRGKTGPDYFHGALELLHATYVGHHGCAHERLADHPALTKELLNRCGCWLFPVSLELPEKARAGEKLPFALTIENRGLAPPYAPDELRAKLAGLSVPQVRGLAAGGRGWMPGAPVTTRHELPLPADLKPREYTLSLGLFDVSDGKERPVDRLEGLRPRRRGLLPPGQSAGRCGTVTPLRAPLRVRSFRAGGNLRAWRRWRSRRSGSPRGREL